MVVARSTASIKLSVPPAFVWVDNTSLVTTEDGSEVVLSRSSEMLILDNEGREKARYRLQDGLKLLKKDGEFFKAGEIKLATSSSFESNSSNDSSIIFLPIILFWVFSICLVINANV